MASGANFFPSTRDGNTFYALVQWRKVGKKGNDFLSFLHSIFYFCSPIFNHSFWRWHKSHTIPLKNRIDKTTKAIQVGATLGAVNRQPFSSMILLRTVFLSFRFPYLVSVCRVHNRFNCAFATQRLCANDTIEINEWQANRKEWKSKEIKYETAPYWTELWSSIEFRRLFIQTMNKSNIKKR